MLGADTGWCGRIDVSDEQRMQIGEVAERTGLSLRTIRYYGEVGLVTPSGRTSGGFRLYSEADIERLDLVKRMKSLDFSLEEMRTLLDLLEHQQKTGSTPPGSNAYVVDQLEMYREMVEARCENLREQLAQAQTFAAHLQRELELRQPRKGS